MRLRTLVATSSLAALAALTFAAHPAAAESTRSIRLELAPAGRFVVENLAGTMRVTPGAGDKVVAVATVHAENDALAGSLRFEQVSGEGGAPTLRVVYPIDRYSAYRYPGAGGDAPENSGGSSGSWAGGWLKGWLGGSSTSTEYAGQRVKVSGSSGVLLYADLEIQIPRRDVEATFRNLVGRITAGDLQGTLAFDSGSGNIVIDRIKGKVTAETGSGDVKSTQMEGSFTGNSGSGRVDLDGFQGESLECSTGSGDIRVHRAAARRLEAGTGSGDMSLDGIDAEKITASTGSGRVTLDNSGSRLASVKVGSGSGKVTVRLAPDATFEAMADLGSGSIVNRYQDAEPILKGKDIVGYRRGAARTRIDVETGSGDFVLEPGV